LLGWNLENDTLECGQWFKGRIYERRCDLSPDGELLAYTAASQRPPLYSWVAVSRPPYLTALALWTDQGMWGGALFGDDWRTLRVNFLTLSETPQKPTGEPMPKALAVSRFEHPGDEDELVTLRLQRDGWTIVSNGVRTRVSRQSILRTRVDPPAIRERSLGAGGLKLRVQLHGTYRANGPLYDETSQVVDDRDQLVADIGATDWAEADHNGDILYAAAGCLYRLQPASGALKKVADLNALSFEEVVAPAWARKWP
jgi:hypothetical protein